MRINTSALNQYLATFKLFFVIYAYSSLFKPALASITSIIAEGMRWALHDFVMPVGLRYLLDFGELLIDFWFTNPFRYMLLGARFLVMVFPEIKTARAPLPGSVTTTTIFRDIPSKVPDSNPDPKLAADPMSITSEAPSAVTDTLGEPGITSGGSRDALSSEELNSDSVLSNAYELPSSLVGWGHNYLNDLISSKYTGSSIDTVDAAHNIKDSDGSNLRAILSRPAELIKNSRLSDSTRLAALCNATNAIAEGEGKPSRISLACLLASSWEGLTRPDGGFKAAFVAGTIPYLLYIYSLLTITFLLPPVVIIFTLLLIRLFVSFCELYTIAFHGPRTWFSVRLLLTTILLPIYLMAGLMYSARFLQVWSILASPSWGGTIGFGSLAIVTFGLLYWATNAWLDDLRNSFTAFQLVEEDSGNLDNFTVHTWLLPNWLARLFYLVARFIYRQLRTQVAIHPPGSPRRNGIVLRTNELVRIDNYWTAVRNFTRRAT
ncbi:hypothetical protein F4775DRAFT_607207 [Biscogniauxia sp. FL1348]|nr:hypothetical protein F4775DRAFT_607207 [Biscogniauxia sp. FL1348]